MRVDVTTSPRLLSSGPATICHLYRARASLVLLPNQQNKVRYFTKIKNLPFRKWLTLNLPPLHFQLRPPKRAMMISLIGDRFLRRVCYTNYSERKLDHQWRVHFVSVCFQMVRVLVSTAVREAAAGAGRHGLLRLIEIGDRRSTAPPAPPHGLCLVKVGYSNDPLC